MGGGGVKKPEKKSDVFYGRPLAKNKNKCLYFSYFPMLKPRKNNSLLCPICLVKTRKYNSQLCLAKNKSLLCPLCLAKNNKQ